MLIIFVRTLFLYLLVVIVTRIMGKRQIGELQPYEFVITIMIADLVTVPMQDRGLSLLSGIIPVLTLLVAQVAFSFWSLKSQAFRRILCGKPSPIMVKGEINWTEMRNNLYHVHDLIEQLRSQGYFNLSDVEFALLETNGSLSVLPKARRRTVTPEDLELAPKRERMPVFLIINGRVEEENLTQAGLTGEWLCNQLANEGITDQRTVLVAMLDTYGRFYYQTKRSTRKEPSS